MRQDEIKRPLEARTFVTIVTAIAWSLVVAVSLAWNIQNDQDSAEKLAISEAKSHFQTELLFRKWNASHGGVYVEPTEKSPPNEYLSHIPHRDVVTTTGKKLTLINPAYMTRQTHERAAAELGIKGHITSLKPIRPQNKPDDWETKALLQFEKGVKEVSSIEYLDGTKFMRYMGALKTEAACLKCHERQGYKLGDVRGGISVSVPYEKYDAILSGKFKAVSIGHFVVWIVGLFGVFVMHYFLARAEIKNRHMLTEAEKLKTRNMLLGSLSEGVYGVDKNGELTFINQVALDILGYKESEVIGRRPHELFHYKHPDGTPYQVEECPSEKSIKYGLKYSCEDTLFDRDGTTIHVFISTVPTFQEQIVSGAVVTFRDISHNVNMRNELEALAKEDPLTGVNNRRVFMENLRQDFAIFKRTNVKCAIIMLDLDHFKSVNDTFGHAAGDEVLKFFTKLSSKEIRAVDAFARIGGEEFGIILRQTNIDGATEFALRLKSHISQSVVKYEESHIRFSVSMGISMFNENDEHEEEVLLRADKALYSAKNLGRNRVEIL